MNSPESPEREDIYTEVEVEVESKDFSRLDGAERLSLAWTKLKTWYGGLPVPARVAVAVVSAFLALSTLTAIVRLVSAVLSALIFGAILIFLYRTAIKSSKTQ